MVVNEFIAACLALAMLACLLSTYLVSRVLSDLFVLAELLREMVTNNSTGQSDDSTMR